MQGSKRAVFRIDLQSSGHSVVGIFPNIMQTGPRQSHGMDERKRHNLIIAGPLLFLLLHPPIIDENIGIVQTFHDHSSDVFVQITIVPLTLKLNCLQYNFLSTWD